MIGRFLSDLIQYGVRGVGNPGLRQAYQMGGAVAAAEVTSIDLDPVTVLVKTRHGWFIADRSDAYLGAALAKYGECSEQENAFLRGLVNPGDTVVEIGSSIGVHAVPLARALGARGKLIAIEAQPTTFQVLCANLALNNLTGVITHHLGIGAVNAVLNMPDVAAARGRLHNSGGAAMTSGGAGVPVKVVPLDELIAGVGQIRLIKIDVEGMELDALRGAEKTIAASRPLIYVENDRKGNSAELIQWLLSAGYRVYFHSPPMFNPDNWFGEAEDIYGNKYWLNMFCVPNEREHASSDGLEQVKEPAARPYVESHYLELHPLKTP